MIVLTPTQKDYIQDELINDLTEEIVKYIENNKEADLFVIHSVIYYKELDKVHEILSKLEITEDMNKNLLLYVSEKGLGLDKFKYFLSKIDSVDWTLAYTIITEEKETDSYDCIKHLIDSNKIKYAKIVDKNIDFVNNLFLFDVEKTFEAVKNNKYIMNILLNNIDEMEESEEIKKYIVKNKIEEF